MFLSLLVLLVTQLGTLSYGQEDCVYQADIAVVINLSQDSKRLWTKTRIFIKDFFDDLQISKNRTRVGALSSAPSASVRFYMNESELGSAKYMIDSVGRPSGYGDIGETFELLQQNFYRQQRGDRENTPNVVLVFTDGVSLERTRYNIYDYKGNLLLKRQDDILTTRLTKPTKVPTTKPSLPTITATAETDTTDSLSTTFPTPITTEQQQLQSLRNLTLHKMQTRIVIHVMENATAHMEQLASGESYVFSFKNVSQLVKAVQQSSREVCPPEDIGVTSTVSPPEAPMVCKNLPCYGAYSCIKSKYNENVATCECEGNLTSKYCPQKFEHFGMDMNRTCRINQAQKKESSRTPCRGHISVVCPTYGPETGGTDIFIWGKNFPTISKPNVIFLPVFPCDVAFYNSTLIQCKTRHAANYNVRHSLLSLQIESSDGCKTTLPSAFHYRPSAEIENVRPMKISPGGGQLLTIIGKHLDSDVTPRLQITVSEGLKSTMFASVCEVRNNNVVKCESPVMDLAKFRRSIGRKKRDTDDLSFTMGMSYEGYNNFTESLPGLAKIKVTNDPKVMQFEEQGITKTFSPIWPNNDKLLRIKGEYLLDAFEATDYQVRIGKSYCIMTGVSAIEILCVPPKRPPQKMNESSSHPEVMVYHGATSSLVGHLKYDMSPWSNTGFRVGVSIAIVLCILLIIAAIAYFAYLMRNKEAPLKKPFVPDERKNIYLVGDYLDPNVDIRLALDAELENKLSGLIIPKETVQEDDTIHTGNQGLIANGWMLDAQKNQTKELTIKAIKEKGAPFMHVERFLQAAVNLRGCNHRNVMQVLGIVTERNQPQAVYSHMEYGDLKQHLCDLREKVLRIDFKEMLHYCEDAAAGLAYIHEKGIVHEDIAARNCWVDKQNVVKICDAALASDLHEEEYYLPGEKLRPLPIRWMSPESMVHKVFTMKSDVWSFGVLLWEIMSLGDLPYLPLTDLQIQDHVEKGNRMGKPDLSTVAMYALMIRCWGKDHKKRPTMQEVSAEMQSFIQGEFMNPTLARPPKGKKGGLSVLTTPVVKGDGKYKGKFIKNSVMTHDNKAFLPDSPGSPPYGISENDIINENIAKQEDYEAEYDYLTPDLIHSNGTPKKNNTPLVDSDVALDVKGVKPGDLSVDNKTYDINSKNFYENNGGPVHPLAAALQRETEDDSYEIPEQKISPDNYSSNTTDNDAGNNYDETDGYDTPQTRDTHYNNNNNINGVHGENLHSNHHHSDHHHSDHHHSNSSVVGSIRSDGSTGSRGNPSLTGIRASFLEADGYKMEGCLSDASVLY